MKQLPLVLLLLLCMAFVPHTRMLQNREGAWISDEKGITYVLLVADNYLSLTAYAEGGKSFLYTLGGPVRISPGQWVVNCEYDSKDAARVGTQMQLPLQLGDKSLTAGKTPIYHNITLPPNWTLLDNGKTALAGNWRITQRMQEGKLQQIHQSGTRKTVKLLTGTRFQWMAIDPGVKGFYGTGGGTYTFKDGKYTEHIEFFSRDSSRVGANLSFTGKLDNGDWHHSGKSSRGAEIYEVWSRK